MSKAIDHRENYLTHRISGVIFTMLFLALGTPAFAQSTNPETSPKPKASPQWVWNGYEIFGQRNVSREQIIELISLEMGSPFTIDRDSWRAWEATLLEKYDFHKVKISAVRFSDQNAYLTVDVVQKDETDRLSYRDAPQGHVDAPEDVMELGSQLNDRIGEMFNQGKPPASNMDNGYQDFTDETLHALVEELVKIAPLHRETLVQIVRDDADKNKRASAAKLLNWAGDVQQSILDVHDCVNDPNSGVRNNITRFMLHFVYQLEDPEAQRVVIDSMATQLRRPSHSDRNKAIYALLYVAESHPEASAYIKTMAGETIVDIAQNSVLYNVRDPARDLLNLIEESEKATSQPATTQPIR